MKSPCVPRSARRKDGPRRNSSEEPNERAGEIVGRHACCSPKCCAAETFSARSGSAAEFHEGCANDPRPQPARQRANAGAYGTALRLQHVGGILRTAWPAPAGDKSGSRTGEPCKTDCGNHDETRASVARTRACCRG